MIYRTVEKVDKALALVTQSLEQALIEGDMDKVEACTKCIDQLLDDRLKLAGTV